MLAVLLAIALIGITLLVLTVAGALAAVITGVALLNVFAMILGLRSRSAPGDPSAEEQPWQPKSFPAPPAAPVGSDQENPSVTVHRR